ncbi:hypothetical protein GCM10010441_23380 [Kitasatospora paracochleata]
MAIGGTSQGDLFANLGTRPAIDFNKVILKEVAESGQHTSLLATDIRQALNDTIDSPQKRRIKFSQTFERIPMISIDRATTRGNEGGISIAGIGTLAGRTQETVTRHYSRSDRTSASVEEEVEVTVPPGRSVEVAVEWMLVRKEGIVIFQERMADSEFRLPLTFEIPYCMPIEVVAGRTITRDISANAKGSKEASTAKGRTSAPRDNLSMLTKAELYHQASDLGIPRRSVMTRSQLQDAVAKALRRIR